MVGKSRGCESQRGFFRFPDTPSIVNEPGSLA